MRTPLLLITCGLLLAGCEQLGIDDPAKVAAAKEAEGRAIGSACRHSGRALEDCYTLNPKAVKAAVFGGWRDMDAYMRENNIQVVRPEIPLPPPPPSKSKKKPGAEEAPADAAPESKPGASHSGMAHPRAPAAAGSALI